MELFKNTNYDFLGKKWPFIIASLVLTGVGFVSLAIKGGPRYGIDFRGGTQMVVKFLDKPQVEKIRSALGAKIGGEISVVDIADTVSTKNEVMIDTDLQLRDERELDSARKGMVDSLNATFGQSSGKLDINNTGQQALAERLRDPLARAGASLSDQQLQDLSKAILTYRDTPPRSGLIRSIGDLSVVAGVTPQMIAAMDQELYAAPFSIRTVEIVGPKVGGELRQQAILATLYALGGMLVYIAFRFEWIYGVAAVVAVFHDTIITIGLFSIFNKEISLTAVAALLTLVGYSMNDTIVVFDRIRENLKLMRREKLESLINISVNQTLSRTILASGLTFLTAMSLWIFGGQVLNGFSFALVVGITVGTYSSVFIASPILVFWQNWVDKKKSVAAAGPAPKAKTAK
jgi:preprotein translocase subunit SecF